MRVGIPLIQNAFNGRSGWIAGFYYVKNSINAIATLPSNDRPEVIAFVPSDFKQSLLLPEYSSDSEWLKIISIPCDRNGNSTELQKYFDENPCDVYFPFNTIPTFCFNAPMIGWIPDFQHKYIPQFFSETDQKDRELTFHFLLSQSSKIVCSSYNVAQDVEKFYSFVNKDKIAILQFKSSFSFSQSLDEKNILEKYAIDKKYIYLPNQFWMHKNHKTVFEAWHQLKLNRYDYLLVCTGETKDYRNLNYFDELNSFVKNNNLENNIRILGFIDRDEQIQLYKNASAILQPSLFEGWNTSIEDAKAYGKPLIVSDLPVHHEQCGESAYYFNKNDSTALAKLIRDIWATLPQGYDKDREAKAVISYKTEIQEYAKNILNTLKSAISSHNKDEIESRELVFKLSSELQEAYAHLTARRDVIAELKEALDLEREIVCQLKHEIVGLNDRLREDFSVVANKQ